MDATVCPPLTSPATTPAPAASGAQSWGDAPARIAAKPMPSKSVQQNTDVEVFDSGSKTTTVSSIKSESSEKPSPNINIEIHNVFSFGTTNNSTPSRNEDIDSKFSQSQSQQNHSSPPIIYA